LTKVIEASAQSPTGFAFCAAAAKLVMATATATATVQIRTVEGRMDMETSLVEEASVC